jgi:small conductance mechanosensitive channel
MLLQVNFFSNLLQQAQHTFVTFIPKLAAAIAVYLIGAFIIKKVLNLFNKLLNSKSYDKSLQSFLISLVRILLTLLLVLTVIGMLGVPTSSFAALLAGAGLAIGAALNGSLGNLAGGVMLLIFKPFKIGDLIEAQGTTGTVKEQGIFATTILTPDNKLVFLPNGALSTGIISNYTAHGNLRVDINIAIALDADVAKAKQIAMNVLKNNQFVLQNPTPEVHVQKVADGMCTLAIRPYCKQEDYWTVFFGITESVKQAFVDEKIDGPVPTRLIISK